ncbi:hypothetical protein Bbelb_048850 [Branchiostoma belcheri]|nr:hypothetical protein Bbelb_048850 [Branchiostoma belcheri]
MWQQNSAAFSNHGIKNQDMQPKHTETFSPAGDVRLGDGPGRPRKDVTTTALSFSLEWFGKLGELRSVKGCIELVENPDRANIKLHVSQEARWCAIPAKDSLLSRRLVVAMMRRFRENLRRHDLNFLDRNDVRVVKLNKITVGEGTHDRETSCNAQPAGPLGGQEPCLVNGDVDDGYVSRDECDPAEEKRGGPGAVRDAYPGGEDGAGHINTNNRPTKQTDTDDFFEDKVKDPRDNQELSTTRWRQIANAPRSGKRLHGGGRKVTNPEKDRSLVEWLEGLRDKGVAVNSTMMKIQAKKLSGGGDSFRVSNGWLCCLKKYCGLSTRRKTSATEKLPQDFEDKVLSFQRRMIPLREQCDYPMCDVFNMDETPLTFDMPSDWTHWEERL